MARALRLDAVVARVPALAAARRHAREVGLVADEVVGGGELRLRLGRQPLRARRAEPDDGHAAAATVERAVARATAGGTSTSDMYGTLPSTSRSALSRSSSELARST